MLVTRSLGSSAGMGSTALPRWSGAALRGMPAGAEGRGGSILQRSAMIPRTPLPGGGGGGRSSTSSSDSSLVVPWLQLILASRARRRLTFLPVAGSTRSRVTAAAQSATPPMTSSPTRGGGTSSSSSSSSSRVVPGRRAAVPWGRVSENEHRHKHEKLTDSACEAGTPPAPAGLGAWSPCSRRSERCVNRRSNAS